MVGAKYFFAMDRLLILFGWYVSQAAAQATEFDVASVYPYPLPVGNATPLINVFYVN